MNAFITNFYSGNNGRRVINLGKIKLAVVEDHTILRQSVVKNLNMEFDMEVVGSWGTAEEALDYLKIEPFDVAVMDYKLPGISGVEALPLMKEIRPDIKVIILSAFTGNQEVFGAIEAGAMGYLPKVVTIEALVEAIRTVNQGNAVIDPSVTRKVLEKFSGMKTELDEKNDILSGNEKKVLLLASEGVPNKQIASRLKLNEGVVKSILQEIFKKLEARDRTHAVAIALKRGLL